MLAYSTDLNISHISVVAVGDESNWNDSRNNISAVLVQPPPEGTRASSSFGKCL